MDIGCGSNCAKHFGKIANGHDDELRKFDARVLPFRCNEIVM
jgi:hypothetical protein